VADNHELAQRMLRFTTAKEAMELADEGAKWLRDNPDADEVWSAGEFLTKWFLSWEQEVRG